MISACRDIEKAALSNLALRDSEFFWLRQLKTITKFLLFGAFVFYTAYPVGWFSFLWHKLFRTPSQRLGKYFVPSKRKLNFGSYPPYCLHTKNVLYCSHIPNYVSYPSPIWVKCLILGTFPKMVLYPSSKINVRYWVFFSNDSYLNTCSYKTHVL